MTIDIKNATPSHLVNGAIITAGYTNLYYSSHPSNCKVCSIDNIQQICNDTYIEDLKRLLKSNNKLIFNVQLNNKASLEFLRKHFKEVSVAKLPIGYNEGYQYHCSFLTGNTNYSKYTEYLARIEKQAKNDKVIEPKAVTPTPKIIAVDNIDGIFNSLKNISEEDLKKIKSYKQPKRAKDLLKSILDKE